MSNVVTSQPRREAKINSKELPSSEINCERCREDVGQCCFVYFYALYCNKCRCSGCCDEEKQERRISQRRAVNYITSDQRPLRHVVKYYSIDNDIMLNDDTFIIRSSLYDDNGLIHTFSDYKKSDVPEYGGTTDNIMGHYESGDHGCYGNRGNFSSGHHSGGGSHSGEGGPSGTSRGYSWGHSESGGYIGDYSVSGRHCVSRAHSGGGSVSGGHSGDGDASGAHCWGRNNSDDYSGGNNGGGDTGGDYGGGDTGGDCGGGDTGGGGDD